MKVMIAVPGYASMTMGTAQGLVATAGNMMPEHRDFIAGIEWEWLFADGWGLAVKQNDFLRRAVERNCDALLHIETDISFLPVHVARIVQSYNVAALAGPCIVGALYPSSSMTNHVVGSLRATEHPRPDVRGPMTPFETAALERAVLEAQVKLAWNVGMGFTVIGRPVIDKMLAAYRYPFEEPLDDEDPAGFVTSDTIFCRRVWEQGMSVLADAGCHVGHGVKDTMTIMNLVQGERARRGVK